MSKDWSQAGDKRLGRQVKLEFNLQMPRGTATAAQLETMRKLKEYFKLSWSKLVEDIPKLHKLTPKRVAFAREYALNGRKNRAQAVRRAGYESDNPEMIDRLGRQLIQNEAVVKLIEAFEVEHRSYMTISVPEVVAYFQKIADQAAEVGDFTNANRAMENLAKYLGMFIEKKEITHKVVSSKAELDARIAELTQVLRDSAQEIDDKLRNVG